MIGKQTAQTRHLAKGGHWSRETTAAVHLQCAVGVEDLAAAGPGLGVRVQKLDHRAQRIPADNSIGIDDQHVFADHPP